MDIQKEREAFEAWVNSKGRSVDRFTDGSYKSMTLDKEWEAWQAAKAQAIPEGFVVVPKEPTEKMIDAGVEETSVDWKRLVFGYKAMIEAQEPAND